MKIKIIKFRNISLTQLPSDCIKEVAHLNKKGSLQKKPRGVF